MNSEFDAAILHARIVSGKPVDVKAEIERRFDANVVLWGSEGRPKDWDSDEPGAYVELHSSGCGPRMSSCEGLGVCVARIVS